MKIGVVTTQYASNYGALLQAFALQKYLNDDLKQTSEVLAYYPPHYKDYWRLLPIINGAKSFIVLTIRCLMPKRIIKQKKRFEKLKDFVDQCIPCSKSYYTKKDIESDRCPYDVLMCGSDQIWNASRHSSLQEVWFLSLNGNGWETPKKIAYAPSVAAEIPEHLKPEIANCLKSFTAVSLRESTDIQSIKELYDGQVYHVCDPVFLLSPDQWRTIETKPTIRESYILCYFLNPSEEDREIVREVKKLTGLKVVQIDINDINKVTTDIDILDASPVEFVGLFDNAEYVITNSFHGTAFSLIFQKNLLVMKKKKANSRMESILNKVGLASRMVSLEQVKQMGKNDLLVDYTESADKLSQFIDDSKEYLKKSLGVTND